MSSEAAGRRNKKPPKEFQHDWQFKESYRLKDGPEIREIWVCDSCNLWTANVELYRNEVCGKKDRRKGVSDRRGGQ